MIHIAMWMLSGRQRDEIPKIVMRGLCLRESAIGFFFRSMDEVGKFDRILDKKDGDIVADDVPVAFLGIKLHREAANIPREIGRSFVTGHGRESHKSWSFLSRALKEIGARDAASDS